MVESLSMEDRGRWRVEIQPPSDVQAITGGAEIDLDGKVVTIDAFDPEFELLDLIIQRHREGRLQLFTPGWTEPRWLTLGVIDTIRER